MNKRALDQAASEADAIANAGIEPVLAGRSLAKPLTKEARADLVETTQRVAAVKNGLINLFAVNQAPGAVDASGIFGTGKEAHVVCDRHLKRPATEAALAGSTNTPAGTGAARPLSSGRER